MNATTRCVRCIFIPAKFVWQHPKLFTMRATLTRLLLAMHMAFATSESYDGPYTQPRWERRDEQNSKVHRSRHRGAVQPRVTCRRPAVCAGALHDGGSGDLASGRRAREGSPNAACRVRSDTSRTVRAWSGARGVGSSGSGSVAADIRRPPWSHCAGTSRSSSCRQTARRMQR